jgi:UDP-4-amino-4,6-dideoxy-N-acetyl-beta-L-altrosamine N-acetyltransferase
MTEQATPKSLVRPMAHEDLLRVLAWRNAPEVRRYMYTQHEITLAEHERWFEAASRDPGKHLLIFELDSQALGFVNFTEVARGGIADWGFYAAPDAPKGSGRRLGQAALNYAFSDIKLHKVCGNALANNQRSIQMHQSLGFRQEGILRDQHFGGECYYHVVCFGLLSTEWQPNT